jgi:hypothetical protein
MEPRQATKDAERVAAFVLERTVKKAGPRARQAPRKSPLLSVPGDALTPALSVFAMSHVLQVPEEAARGVLGLASGTHKAEVRDDVPTPDALLSLQARGVRVVSLVADGVDTSPHEDPLAFAVHDLCHLDKFQVEHAGQVGFFRTMENACILHAFDFDETWRRDTIAVTTDMNGSPVFLLAALKMRLKMAVRRSLERAGGHAKRGGPLDDLEEAAYAPVLEELLTRCDLSGTARDAAREITARRKGMDRAHVFVAEMESRGGEALRDR